MKYSLLGSSGLIVSKITLGTMTFGAETPEDEAFAILDIFVENGGNLVDTSNVYAAGETEHIIGRWFADRPSDVTGQVLLASKGRYNVHKDLNAQGLSRRSLHRSLDESLRRLGLEAIDLYQLHAADMTTSVEETLLFLKDAMTAGKIHSYGLSNVTGWQLQLFASTAKALGMALPVSLQPEYSMLSREIEFEIVGAVQHNGMGMLPWSPLAMGLLTGKYERNNIPGGETRAGGGNGMYRWYIAEYLKSDNCWAIIDAVKEIARDSGASPAQVALSWLADRPGVASPIAGARTVAQIKDNLGAGDLVLDDAATRRLEQLSRPIPARTYPYGAFGEAQRDRYLDKAGQVVMDLTAGGSDNPLTGKVN